MASPQQPALVLKAKREKALERRHPWVFSGAIDQVVGEPQGGDTVEVLNSHRHLLGYGAYSPESQIRCRMWAFIQEPVSQPEKFVDELLAARIQAAIDKRTNDRAMNESNARRLIHAESDQIPGLIADQYDDILVVQFLGIGVEKRKGLIVQVLSENLQPRLIYERSDADVRELEGLVSQTGILFQQGGGDLAAEIVEHDLSYQINFEAGHKTGYYLDQRDNRKLLRQYCRDKAVLDCFAYTGGFSLNALAGGAHAVTAVDTSAEALNALANNLHLNNFDTGQVEKFEKDVFEQLRLFRDQARSFDVIILDPPKFAPTRQLAQKAARGYKDINLLASKLLRPGGILFTFSCSGGIDPHFFQQIVAGAALDAEVDLQIIGKMGQASDHPVLVSFPEGEYLKGLVLRR